MNAWVQRMALVSLILIVAEDVAYAGMNCPNCGRANRTSGIGQPCNYCGAIMNDPNSSGSSYSGSSGRGARRLMGGVIGLVVGGLCYAWSRLTQGSSPTPRPGSYSSGTDIGPPAGGSTGTANDDAANDFFKNLEQK
jgi:hypothetical protein